MGENQENSAANKLLDSAIEGIRRYVVRVHDGNVSAAKREFGMTGNTLDSWLAGTRRPSLSKIGPILESIQAQITFFNDNVPHKNGIISHAEAIPNARIRELEEKVFALEREIKLQNEIIALQKETIAALRENRAAPASSDLLASLKILRKLAVKEDIPLHGVPDPQGFPGYLPPEKVDFLLRTLNEVLAQCPEFSRTWLYFGIEQALLPNIPYNDGLRAKLDKLAEARREAIVKMHQESRPPAP